MSAHSTQDPVLLRLLDEAQARQLPALIAEWSRAQDDRRWIARALRIDLALLTERPELAVPCVYRRCAFVGSEHGFYVKRAEVPDLASLRARMQQWADAQRGPWLRALRPPAVPVDGAVVEEYRTSLRGKLWASADGEQIGVVADTAHVAWERATGRRVDIARPSVAVDVRWTCARENTWGRLAIAHGDKHVDIEIENHEVIRSARAITDDLVLVWGADIADEELYGVVDIRRARLLWRNTGDASSIALFDGERLLVALPHAIAVVKMTTGDQLERWQCPFVGQLCALPDGHVASSYGDVIRVWNVGDAIERPQVVLPSANSWTSAEFSPDGKRVVTGQLLCDAESGRFIAALGCNGPSGWLEGGPPRGCQRLCNDVFVEVTPFGLSIWDSDDGKKLVTDDDRSAGMRDCVAFDPNGGYHAVWNERGSLQVYRLVQATLVRELEQAGGDPWGRKLGFSPDGSLLAWETASGERFALPLASPLDDRRIDEAPWEPPPREIEVTDGLLVVDDAAIPCDDGAVVVSPDGTLLAGRHSHYRYSSS